jgi:hypothetical protein
VCGVLALDGGQFGQDLSPFTGSGVGQAAVQVGAASLGRQ